jgi:hypothetical protein
LIVDKEEEMQQWKSSETGKMVSIAFGILGIVCILAVNAFAVDEPDRIRELELKLEEKGQTIKGLADKIKELDERMTERKSEEPKEAPATSTGIHSMLDELTFLHGFADVGFGFSSKRNDPADRFRGFALGSFDLYLTPQLGDRLKTLTEIIFEFEETGEAVAEVERLQIGYTFSDYATVWLGRFHTPYGYWNTAFHHGAQIQTSILRPRFLDFEDMGGGILPAHTNGLWGTGKIGMEGGKLTYDLFVGNGPKIKNVDKGGDGALDPNNVKDDNNDFSVGANIGYEFGATIEGLKIGAHWLRADVDGHDPNDNPLQRSELNVVGGYLIYTNYNWEAIAEFYQFLNKDLSTHTGTHSSQAGFVQLAYNIYQFTPYARFEMSNLDQEDSYFSQQKNGRSYSREILGVRYDLSTKSALKLEGNHTRVTDRGSETYNEIRAQFAVRF